MVDSMIEQVARALCSHAGLPVNTRHGGKPMWMDFVPEARVALTAMREPTEAMVYEGVVVSPYAGTAEEPRVSWRQMIDAALADR